MFVNPAELTAFAINSASSALPAAVKDTSTPAFSVAEVFTDSAIVKVFDPTVNELLVISSEVIDAASVALRLHTLNVAVAGVVSLLLFSFAFDCTNNVSAAMLTPPPLLSNV